LHQEFETGAIILDKKSPRYLEVIGTIKWGQDVVQRPDGTWRKSTWVIQEPNVVRRAPIAFDNDTKLIGYPNPPGIPAGPPSNAFITEMRKKLGAGVH